MRSFCLFLLFPLFSIGQLRPARPLNIGDTVPDVAFTKVFQYPAGQSRLSAFHDRLLILDFWSTWCTTCFRSFPKLDSLQQQFGPRIQVLLVNARGTGDNEKKAAALFEKIKLPSGQKYRLPYLVDDTVLSRFFPHRMVPHCVWIQNGVVKAITAPAEVTSANITAMLNGDPVKLKPKKDLVEFDRSLPLLQNLYGTEALNLVYNSVLTRYVDGLFSGSGRWISPDSSHTRFYYYNRPILGLYEEALGFTLASRPHVLEVSDRSRYETGGSFGAEWASANCYCYELTAPSGNSLEEIRKWMLQDLNRIFGLNARMEKRRTPCRVLVRLGRGEESLATKGGKPARKWPAKAGEALILRNQPLSLLVTSLNNVYGYQSFTVDETGYAGNVDLELKAPLDNPGLLKKELNKYGLDLIVSERELDVFVLTEKGFKHPR
jgi:thiol-disulfide isomerase/thioredoxin